MPSKNLAELARLLNSAAENTLDPEEMKKIGQMLAGDEDAQRYYCCFMDLHQELAVRCEEAEFVEAGLAQRRRVALHLASVKRPLDRRIVISIALLALSSAALALVMLTGKLFHGQAPGNEPLAGAAGNATSTSVRKISIASGKSVLSIEGVGTVTLEGPADFALLGPKLARLDNGRLRMRVTEESGRGYVVQTPDGEITDLGTEFGVGVTTGRSTALAVFEGAVDLRIPDLESNMSRVERLFGGDGVLFSKSGELRRLESIMTGDGAKFEVCGLPSAISFENPLITDVRDSLPNGTTKRYYDIVVKGMNEDALAYVDRLEYNWNGLNSGDGLPKYLRGADYVKTFCDDKRRTEKDFRLTLELKRPAVLFVLYDRRLEVPEWLTRSFQNTGDRVGMDIGKRFPGDNELQGSAAVTGVGPGQSIDQEFDVWRCVVKKRGKIELGPNGVNPRKPAYASMYGIVAIELNADKPRR